MTVMNALMLIGAIGAGAGLLGEGAPTGRIRWAHLVMVVVMVAMLVAGMSPMMLLASGMVLVATAWIVTGERVDRRVALPCALDLTAMGVLFLMASVPSTPVGAIGSAPAHNHQSSSDPRLAIATVLVGWCALTVDLHRRRQFHDARSMAGTGAMMVGMLPLAW